MAHKVWPTNHPIHLWHLPESPLIKHCRLSLQELLCSSRKEKNNQKNIGYILLPMLIHGKTLLAGNVTILHSLHYVQSIKARQAYPLVPPPASLFLAICNPGGKTDSFLVFSYWPDRDRIGEDRRRPEDEAECGPFKTCVSFFVLHLCALWTLAGHSSRV